MSPKIKIEDILPTGEKISVVIEGGEISHQRVLQVLDLFKIIGGVESSGKEKTLKEQMWDVLLNNFGSDEWFTINEAYAALRHKLKKVSVTTVSSYISRFLKEGKLEKKGRKPYTKYRIRKIYTRAV